MGDRVLCKHAIERSICVYCALDLVRDERDRALDAARQWEERAKASERDARVGCALAPAIDALWRRLLHEQGMCPDCPVYHAYSPGSDCPCVACDLRRALIGAGVA